MIFIGNFTLEYIESGINASTDFDGFGQLPPISTTTNSQIDCSNGYYLGPNEMSIIEAKCNIKCQDADDLYQYKYIDEDSKIIINKKRLKSGSWCIPKPLAKCNLNTSYAIRGPSTYQCISAFPELLGGTTGNEIIGCAPHHSFVDLKDNIIYTKYIPNNLIMNDLEEQLEGGEKRYKCFYDDKRYTPLDKLGIGSRFDLEINACSSFEPHGNNYYDPVNKCCKCDYNQVVGDGYIKPSIIEKVNVSPLCSKCTSGYQVIDEDNPQDGSRHGVSVGIDCVDPANAPYFQTIMPGVLPCGTVTLLKIRQDNQNLPDDQQITSGCQRSLVMASNTYSPELLQRVLDGDYGNKKKRQKEKQLKI
ncbi:per-os infectivity factor 2-like protein [Glossina pallidipes salivary gland hypertrophy virus]|uniref:Per-os infectivity factor 2-like protein n=1 Tax=Glossina hytrovirus (isolate Glossina pallidipes/Ethiopia/Seibersdorf/-) TaxID=379529 RepID=B0YLK7_GHVS|nr:per-os infectivity factor 2-like protein [Glossina pallidipes salivary gland hypertrophy virus]ABQ08826.1 per-os infectivity factor 2-like protein [Glossina pallidipes salivary gland hypertrophy virus]